MLIVLHICSLLITYDSGYTSSGDSETLSCQIFGPGRCTVTSLICNCIINLKVGILDSVRNL